MLVRPDALGHHPCLAEIFHRLGVVARLIVDAGQGDERVQRVPIILGGLHHPVGFLVLRRGLAIFLGLLVE